MVEALTQSEEQFRKLVEDAPIPTIMQAEDGEVLQISRSWTELTGYSIDQIRPFDEWITTSVYGEGANKVRDHMHELFKGARETINIEFDIRTAAGELRHWSFNASSPGTLLDGRRFIVGMAVDVTEHRRTEELVAEARDYAEAIITTIREPLIILTGDLRIVTANQSFYRAFNTTKEATEHQLLYDLGNRQWDIPELRKLLEDILPRSSVFNDFKVSHKFPDIGEKTMLLNARKIVQRHDAQPLILLAIEDITGHK